MKSLEQSELNSHLRKSPHKIRPCPRYGFGTLCNLHVPPREGLTVCNEAAMPTVDAQIGYDEMVLAALPTAAMRNRMQPQV
jgi:hypothetical protein